jgi:hypothetical protein
MLGREDLSVNSLLFLDAITVWAKVSKRGSPHFLFISLAAADFMEVAFAVGLNEKMVKFAIVRYFIVCAVKRTRFKLVTHNHSSE